MWLGGSLAGWQWVSAPVRIHHKSNSKSHFALFVILINLRFFLHLVRRCYLAKITATPLLIYYIIKSVSPCYASASEPERGCFCSLECRPSWHASVEHANSPRVTEKMRVLGQVERIITAEISGEKKNRRTIYVHFLACCNANCDKPTTLSRVLIERGSEKKKSELAHYSEHCKSFNLRLNGPDHRRNVCQSGYRKWMCSTCNVDAECTTKMVDALLHRSIIITSPAFSFKTLRERHFGTKFMPFMHFITGQGVFIACNRSGRKIARFAQHRAVTSGSIAYPAVYHRNHMHSWHIIFSPSMGKAEYNKRLYILGTRRFATQTKHANVKWHGRFIAVYPWAPIKKIHTHTHTHTNNNGFCYNNRCLIKTDGGLKLWTNVKRSLSY